MKDCENYYREIDEEDYGVKFFKFTNQDLWELELKELQIMLDILESKYLLFDEDLPKDEQKLIKGKLKRALKKFALFSEDNNNRLVKEVKGFLQLTELENQLQMEFGNSVPGRIRKIILYKRLKR